MDLIALGIALFVGTAIMVVAAVTTLSVPVGSRVGPPVVTGCAAIVAIAGYALIWRAVYDARDIDGWQQISLLWHGAWLGLLGLCLAGFAWDFSRYRRYRRQERAE